MWSYYSLIVGQDDVAYGTFTLPPAAKLECRREDLERALTEERQRQIDTKKTAYRTMLAEFANAISDLFRKSSVHVH